MKILEVQETRKLGRFRKSMGALAGGLYGLVAPVAGLHELLRHNNSNWIFGDCGLNDLVRNYVWGEASLLDNAIYLASLPSLVPGMGIEAVSGKHFDDITYLPYVALAATAGICAFGGHLIQKGIKNLRKRREK